MEFQQEQSTFAVDNQYMIGDIIFFTPVIIITLPASERPTFIVGAALLACPVTDPAVQEVKVLLPGSEEVTLIALQHKESVVEVYRHLPLMSPD